MTETKTIEHDEIEQFLDSETEQNPRSDEFNIFLSIPETIEIKMVDASNLADYEIWTFFSSALLSFLIGFSVAWIQEKSPSDSKTLGIVSFVFLGFFIASLIMTLVKRHTVHKKGKSVKLKTSKIVES